MRVAYVSADPDIPTFANRAGSLGIREMCVAMLDTGFDVSLFVACHQSRNAWPRAYQ